MPSKRYIEAIDYQVVRYMSKLKLPIIYRGIPKVIYSDRSEYIVENNTILLHEGATEGELAHLAHELVHSHQIIPWYEIALYYREDGSINHEIWKRAWFEQQAEAVAKLVCLQLKGYPDEVEKISKWPDIGLWCHASLSTLIKWANL